jgi:DNA-binding LacI/PurR family transcriptional regulator
MPFARPILALEASFAVATTIDDIARAAGVHRSTVARALLNDSRLTAKTCQRIRALAVKMKYRPNQSARSLSVGRSRIVGVLAPSSNTRQFYTVYETIRVGLAKHGYTVVLYVADGYADESACFEPLVADRVAGALVHPASEPAGASAYKALTDFGAKLMVIDGYIEGLQVPQVLTDPYRSFRASTEYLLSLGHERIAYLATPETTYVGRQRARGFREALQEAGIAAGPSPIVETPLRKEDGAAAMAKLLRRKRPPTAIIARHDLVAMGAMEAVFAAGLSVPEDVSIVGYQDVEYASMLRVPLTTVRYPADELGKIVVDTMVEMLEGKPVEPEARFLTEELVIRSSCAPPCGR